LRLASVREEVLRQTEGAKGGIEDLTGGDAGGGQMAAVGFRKV
jgi:hypothetical protein